jgi:anti-anti-sigma regulatory factor
MESHNTIAVRSDSARNLIEISFVGVIGAGEIERYETAVTAALAAVSRGFFVYADFTELNSMDSACIPALERTMDRLREHGIARVVRVIPDPGKDIGFGILSLFHYPRSVKIVTCPTRAEAELALQ